MESEIKMSVRDTLLKRSFGYFKSVRLKNNARLRTIYVNNKKPTDYDNSVDMALKYKSNRIITSKYNFVTFLPKNLYEQFKRIANFYFLTNVIIQFIIPNPPTSPFAAVLPLIIVILVTAVKKGISLKFNLHNI